jgi:dihydroorotate dehydrogenase (NAD+) catalytic subunit
MKIIDLGVDIGGICLKNPVMTASGTFGYAKEFEPFLELDMLGAIIFKGLSSNPSNGNPPPRIVETASGMLNAIGLENVGLEAFLQDKLPYLETLNVPIIANIYGTSVEAYAQLAGQLNDVEAIAGVEVNISCPNVRRGGMAFGADEHTAKQVTRAVRSSFKKTLMVKLSPNVTDIVRIAKSVEEGGADALSLINTLTGMAVDIHTRRPKLANVTGGLSGPAIKPVALRMVWQTAQIVDIPVVGVGGIFTAEDAIEFIMAGASAVQVGTANFVNPRSCMEIIQGIERFLEQRHIKTIRELIGSLIVD